MNTHFSYMSFYNGALLSMGRNVLFIKLKSIWPARVKVSETAPLVAKPRTVVPLLFLWPQDRSKDSLPDVDGSGRNIRPSNAHLLLLYCYLQASLGANA